MNEFVVKNGLISKGNLTVNGIVTSNNVIYDLNGNSIQWNSTYTTVCANSSIWDRAYTNLITNSAAYLTSIDLGNISTLSGNWNSVYTNVNLNSAIWSLTSSNVDLGDIPTLSGNWNSTYTTVCANSAIWSLTAVDINLGDIPVLSGNWNSVYTTVCANSGIWNLTAANVDLGNIPALSGNWNSVYTTVNLNSANWILTGGSADLGDIPALSGNWNSTYTTVCANSAIWTLQPDLSSYITINSISAEYLKLDASNGPITDDLMVSANLIVTNNITADQGTLSDIHIINHAYFNSEYNNGNSATSQTISWINGNKQKTTLTDNCTCIFISPSGAGNFLLKVVQGGSGGYVITWPSNVNWPSGTTPTLSTAVSSIDILTFYFDNINYYGVASLDFK